ncbi:ThiF family adenylyltransferase [Candidatus Ruminimicrobium bovinum]|uniref:tRNA threonylcarbamoyladenosine dehydratase n=1 Tax=Candidatus Ruminimicrobium bovinum TaxID=3242779 RepID=UPI0039B922C8
MLQQFQRTVLLFGQPFLDKLSKSKVLVVGIGAVGGFAVEMLARFGVGNIYLADFDVIQESNINRQLYATHSNIGKKKTLLAKERIVDINPGCKVKTFNLFVNNDTFNEIFSEIPDIVIDAIDSYSPKLRLIEYCYKNNIKIISSMGAALKTDPLSIKYSDLFETHHCKLAERLRGDLRKTGISHGIPCVFSEQAPQVKAIFDKDNRKILGSSPVVTSIFGILIANKAVEFLIKEEI